ncbi:MAG: dihydrofolate reductase family protein [Acidimicrobiales bacterium]
MRRLVVNTFLSLDGVMQAPGGPEEDPTGGFTLGGWSVNYWDEVMGQVMDESMSRPAELLLGRKTYEVFAAHWPHVTDDPAAGHLNSIPKHVASTTLDKVEWNNSTLIEGDVSDYVTNLKNQDGPEIQVHGSWNLIQTLLEHDLVDEFRMWTFPVLLGSGKRLFGEGTIPAGLKALDVKTSSTGVVMATYERAGEIDVGSFALEESTEAELERRQKLGDTA